MIDPKLEKYIIDARARMESDQTIIKDLSAAGWSESEVRHAMRIVADSTPRRSHYKGPVIFFLVFAIVNVWLGYWGNVLYSKTFILGALIIDVILTIVFAIISLIIRKISIRFGKVWAYLLWLIVIIVVAFLVYKFWPSFSIKPVV